VIDRLIPPHPAYMLSCGRGVEALVLAMLNLASIMASATPSASVPGTSTSVPEERGVGGPRRHAEEPKVAATVIKA